MPSLTRRHFLAVLCAATLLSCRRQEVPTVRYPGEQWIREAPQDQGLEPRRFDALRVDYQGLAHGSPWRCTIARRGAIIYEDGEGTDPSQPIPAHSVVKSLIASATGIARAQGLLPDLDAPVVKLFPELQEAKGAKGSLLARQMEFQEKDHAATLGMLLDHTSGVMDGRKPTGADFYYATLPKVILLNILWRELGQELPSKPDTVNGPPSLLKRWIGDPIGAKWDVEIRLLGMEEGSLNHLFGFFPTLTMQIEDYLRLGWLWLNEGRWHAKEVIPAAWHRECIHVSRRIREVAPKKRQIYGYGFWSNSEGQLWPTLPRDLYMAAGFGDLWLVMFPQQQAVALLSPAPRWEGSFVEGLRREELITPILNALS